jgi:hypothetical protein
MNDLEQQSSFSRNVNPPLLSSSFGPLYGRQMCVFVLRLDKVLLEQKVRFALEKIFNSFKLTKLKMGTIAY